MIGVGPLVKLLGGDGGDEAQEYALWSLSLVTDVSGRKEMVAQGCIAPVVKCLTASSLHTPPPPPLLTSHAWRCPSS